MKTKAEEKSDNKTGCCERCKGTGIVQKTGEHYDSCVDIDCPCHAPEENLKPQEQEEWKKELVEICRKTDERTWGTRYRVIVKFIRNLLAAQKEEVNERR
jgi:excinuclease UvrABC ATPase subunit